MDMKLTVQTFLTLDGVMQAPGGPEEDPSGAFTHRGWQAPFPDPAVGEFITELTSHASAFLPGRRTFGIFRGYWPDQADPTSPIATAINSCPSTLCPARSPRPVPPGAASTRHRPPGDRRRRRGGAGAEGRTRRRAADLGKQHAGGQVDQRERRCPNTGPAVALANARAVCRPAAMNA